MLHFFGVAGKAELDGVANTAQFASNMAIAMVDETTPPTLSTNFKCFTVKPSTEESPIPRSMQFMLHPDVRVCMDPVLAESSRVKAFYDPADRAEGSCINFIDATVCMAKADQSADPLMPGLLMQQQNRIKQDVEQLKLTIAEMKASY